MKQFLLRAYKLYAKILFRKLTAQEAMQLIYRKGWWGRPNKSNFYSGRGSHDLHIIEPYIDFMNNFIKLNDISIIVDLGCGDFNIGSRIFQNVKKYIACDIVPELIHFNKNKYVYNSVVFCNIDAIKDKLPKGEVLMVRQVFQHLTNQEIQAILDKVYDFKYLIVTEGLPKYDFEPNKDHFHGPDIRLSKKSGVVVHEYPFNFKYKSMNEVLRISDPKDSASIVTTIYEL